MCEMRQVTRASRQIGLIGIGMGTEEMLTESARTFLANSDWRDRSKADGRTISKSRAGRSKAWN